MPNNKLIKIISIAAASAVGALLFGLVFKNFINSGTLSALIFTVLAAVVFMAVFVIQSLLI